MTQEPNKAIGDLSLNMLSHEYKKGLDSIPPDDEAAIISIVRGHIEDRVKHCSQIVIVSYSKTATFGYIEILIEGGYSITQLWTLTNSGLYLSKFDWGDDLSSAERNACDAYIADQLEEAKIIY